MGSSRSRTENEVGSAIELRIHIVIQDNVRDKFFADNGTALEIPFNIFCDVHAKGYRSSLGHMTRSRKFVHLYLP